MSSQSCRPFFRASAELELFFAAFNEGFPAVFAIHSGSQNPLLQAHFCVPDLHDGKEGSIFLFQSCCRRPEASDSVTVAGHTSQADFEPTPRTKIFETWTIHFSII